MCARQIAATLLITGSAIFFVGAAIGVPRVFMTPDPAARLQLLNDQIGAWRAAQPLYSLGPFVAAVGVGFLAAASRDTATRSLYTAACAALVLGVLPWAWTTYDRGQRVREFAYGQLPAWPFVAYVLLTIAGIALVGIGLLRGPAPTWLGWATIGADVLFLLIYAGTRDIPPFVFYLLFTMIGIVLATL